VVAAVTSRPLVLVLLGRDWLPLRAAFDVIIFGLLFRTSSKLTDSLMKARGAVYRRGWRGIVFAVSVFVGAYVGQHWGLHGVAVGVLIALALNYLLTNQLCLVLTGLGWRDFAVAHVPALVLSVVGGVVAFVVDRVVATAHPAPVLHLLPVWVAAVVADLVLVRVAWRGGPLGSLAELVATLHGFLAGRPARAVARLLGPGYAPRLRRPSTRTPAPVVAAG
jgi:O-antigen/teichoic acid export membrane protein